MFYVKNLPVWERLLRTGGGMMMAIYALSGLEGTVVWLLSAAGAGVALSGLMGFCPMCAMAGRRLQNRKAK
ncbi:MAG TPA: DUF2892 domain-containing protein [Burkholderiales bacterium]|nr:DUF2892 domain-containing protein [Burkholderiales bacterium]